MHDPEFEKEVQKKMEELEFTPSEGVWMNLQRGLYKKERRRAPVLWLFFLLGGVLLGAGGVSLYYFHRSSSQGAGVGRSEIARTASTGIGPTETKTATDAPITVGQGSGKPGSAESGSIKSGSTQSESIKSGSAESGSIKSGSTQSGSLQTGKIESGSLQTGSLQPASIKTGSANGSPVIRQMAVVGGDGTVDGEGFANNGQENTRVHAVAITSMGLSLHRAPSGNIDYRPGGRPNIPHVNKLPALSSVTAMDKRAAKKARFAAHPSWEAGFAGGGGVSSAIVSVSSASANQQAFQPTLVTALQAPSSSASHMEMRICRVQPDLSFWAGIFVQRPVMKRLSFTAGLNLHYFSTRLETMAQKGGYAVGNNITTLSGSTPFYNSSPYVQNAGAASYYGADYKFNNRYYFLQLPVSLQWQVNRSRKTPIFWEGGLALSRLISTNALYYSEKSGLYYKDGGGANPNHLMAFSSLMVGLSLRGNSIKIGPEGQYGLNSLIHGNIDNQHLFYGGIKITVTPRKW